METKCDKCEVMPMATGELLDRLTILLMKMNYDPEFYEQEYENILNGLKIAFPLPFVLALICELAQVNQRIWNLEADIRKGIAMADADIGKRAVAIRKINDRRVEIKNKINEIYDKKAVKEKKIVNVSLTSE